MYPNRLPKIDRDDLSAAIIQELEASIYPLTTGTIEFLTAGYCLDRGWYIPTDRDVLAALMPLVHSRKVVASAWSPEHGASSLRREQAWMVVQ